MNGASSNGHSDANVDDALRQELSKPETISMLRDLLARLDVIYLAVESADGLLRRADTLTENVADGVAELRRSVDGSTVEALASLAARTPELVDALDTLRPAMNSDALAKLVDVEVLDSLAKLTEHVELLLFAAESAQGFLARAETLADNAAGGVVELRKLLGDDPELLVTTISQLGSLLPGLQAALGAIVRLNEAGALEALLSSNVLAPEVVRVVGDMGDALHATHVMEAGHPTKMGPIGLLKSMRDPDVQRALGFFQRFMKEFGSRLPKGEMNSGK